MPKCRRMDAFHRRYSRLDRSCGDDVLWGLVNATATTTNWLCARSTISSSTRSTAALSTATSKTLNSTAFTLLAWPSSTETKKELCELVPAPALACADSNFAGLCAGDTFSVFNDFNCAGFAGSGIGTLNRLPTTRAPLSNS